MQWVPRSNEVLVIIEHLELYFILEKMKLQHLSKIIPLVIIFLSFSNHGICTHSFLPENNSIFLHGEVIIRVGVVLDMESSIGKSIYSFLKFAMSDFYARNNNYRTRIVLHTMDSKSDPLQALLAGMITFFYSLIILSTVHDLLNNIKVQAIIGPETYIEAKLLVPIADKAKVPIFSFVGFPFMEYPFLFQIKEDESVMSKSITTLVDSFGWRKVIFLYEDIDSGSEILSYFLQFFQDKSIKVNHGSAVFSLSTDDQITQVLQKITISRTTVVVVHMSSLLATRVILIAKRLGMVSEEYAWIMTYKTIDIVQPMNNEVIESCQGVIVLRSYIPASGKLFNLTTRWYNKCYEKYPSLVSEEISVLAIWAYDTIWALAESFQRLGVQFSFDATQIDLMLQLYLSKIRFKGVSGEFQLNDRKLVSNGFKIVNVIRNGERIRSTSSIKRRMLQTTNVIKLKVGVLIRRKFTGFIDAYHDNHTNVTNAKGFSKDVFDACISGLPYKVEYELIPFVNKTYDDLIKNISANEIDVIMGDSTILANRSQVVDFTTTYTDLGIGTLVRINYTDMWIFLKPFDADLWLISALFAFLTGFVVWLASKGLTVGFHGGSFVAGKTVNNLHFEDSRHRPYYSYEDYAIALSKDGKHGGVDAIIDEIPYIKMFLSQYPNDYAMIASEPTTSGFGFIFRKGSLLVKDMSIQIATIREIGTLGRLEKKWFKKQSPSSADSPSKPKTLSFSRFRGLFLINGISLALALLLSLVLFLHRKLEIYSIILVILQQNLVAHLSSRSILYMCMSSPS
ncbi:hypothetical protein QVD17_17379 [Tagetes erecta]|uniref:Glutamate receptor n=1 Tax=Tagetes erecta TaxID=13708 RepID=A0AAD8KVX4_TARER|nr:hypothetical protein QVD17_17379 [Tagetes erecta]